MAEVILIDLGYCKIESFLLRILASSTTGPSPWISRELEIQLVWPQPFWVKFNLVRPPTASAYRRRAAPRAAKRHYAIMSRQASSAVPSLQPAICNLAQWKKSVTLQRRQTCQTSRSPITAVLSILHETAVPWWWIRQNLGQRYGLRLSADKLDYQVIDCAPMLHKWPCRVALLLYNGWGLDEADLDFWWSCTVRLLVFAATTDTSSSMLWYVM